MSEEPTKEMSQKYDTKPTIETVLERIEAMRSEMQASITEMRSEMQSEIKAVRVETQVGFDRVESLGSSTRAEVLAMRSEFLTLRGDFRELRHALGEHIPSLKA
jgi:hypothetical protein